MTLDQSNDTLSAATIPFDGTKKNYEMWRRNFLAQGDLLGTSVIYDGTYRLPVLPDKVEYYQDEHTEAVKLNQLAFLFFFGPW